MVAIGFIGLGQMGAAIVARLAGVDGIHLHLYDPDAARMADLAAAGAVAHADAAAVADAAEIVFACLPHPAASRAVAQSVSAGGALTTYVEMSTIGRSAIRDIAAILAPRGIVVVDAPVSGGPAAARDGRLTVMAAGAPADLERVRPLLEAITSRIFAVGDEPGQAQMMKLVNNLIASALIAVTAEAMAAGAAAGLDPATMIQIIDASSGQSSVSSGLFVDQVLTGRFAFGATIATMVKDIDLGLGEACAVGAPMPIHHAIAAGWHEAGHERGWDEDLTRYFGVVKTAASPTVAGPRSSNRPNEKTANLDGSMSGNGTPIDEAGLNG